MDKIFSTRMDEAVISYITVLSQRLRTTKKNVVEEAIRQYGASIEDDHDQDIFEMTSGVWERDESASDTVRKAKKLFRESMERHHH